MADNYQLDWQGDAVKTAMFGARAAALKIAAVYVETQVKMRCPVGQYPKGSGRVGGRLRSSYHHGVDPSGYEAWVGTNVEYAPFVEMGTRHMAARPHLRPVLHEDKAKIEALLAAALRAAIQRGLS